VPFALPTPGGILVNERGCIRLMSPDLSTDLWRQLTDDWGTGPFVVDDVAFFGPVAGWLRGYDVASGQCVLQLPFPEPGSLCDVHHGVYVIDMCGRERYGLFGVDASRQIVCVSCRSRLARSNRCSIRIGWVARRDRTIDLLHAAVQPDGVRSRCDA
jgi:hypothetical protein